MYSWTDDGSGWYGAGSYSYSDKVKAKRDAAASREAAHGPRTYEAHRRPPNPRIIAPDKRVESQSRNPLIVAVDVTGSMARWPFEIFDRLPLLYTTLAQYREDLEILFAAIGDASVDDWPLQVTSFASGFDLEQQLKALYGEGGGGDAPESYGLFAYWVRNHVHVPNASSPFLIVFGDAPMHPRVPSAQIHGLLKDSSQADADALDEWRQVASSWNTWFLRRPGGGKGDATDKQWHAALGKDKVVRIQDEQRAVDYAMGIIARSWGHFDDFRANMKARQDESKVRALEKVLDDFKVRALSCPRCAAPIPDTASGMFRCAYCASTLTV